MASSSDEDDDDDDEDANFLPNLQVSSQPRQQVDSHRNQGKTFTSEEVARAGSTQLQGHITSDYDAMVGSTLLSLYFALSPEKTSA